MLSSETAADLVYSKNYREGTVYALVYSGYGRNHRTLDRKINALDTMLKELNGTSTTCFVSISDQYSGKVKTFGSDGEKRMDEHYNVIFNARKSGSAIKRKHALNPGVLVYSDKDFSASNSGFDVVKKRELIASSNTFVGSDITETLLGGKEEAEYFFSFSSEVCICLLL
jgi:hypothetical protein